MISVFQNLKKKKRKSHFGKMDLRCPDIPCKEHEGEIITNFCCQQSCLSGLCPECIDEHYKSHRANGITSEIDTIKTIKNMCEKHQEIGIRGISEEINRLEGHHKVGPNEVIQEGVSELTAVRRAFHQVIDNHFDSIQNAYAERINHDMNKFYDFKELSENQHEILHQLKRLHEGLRSPQLIESVSKSSRLDMKDLLENYRAQVDGAQGRRLSLPSQVTFSQEKLKTFEGELKNYVALKDRSIGVNLLGGIMDAGKVKHRGYEENTQSDQLNQYFKSKFIAT